jgi:hypothetical protein
MNASAATRRGLSASLSISTYQILQYESLLQPLNVFVRDACGLSVKKARWEQNRVLS